MNKEELQNKISEVEKMLYELKDELEDMEEREATKENYLEACELCRKLFLGEKE